MKEHEINYKAMKVIKTISKDAVSTHALAYLYRLLVYRGFDFIATHTRHLGFQ
jgi:hypothetical protein